MTTTVPNIQTLQTAIESRDADGVAAWYEADAVLTIADRDHPPATPQVYRGAEQIHRYYADVCSRNINHRVTDIVVDTSHLAFIQHCRYPDGNAVVCATVAELNGSLIHRQTVVQAWDA